MSFFVNDFLVALLFQSTDQETIELVDNGLEIEVFCEKNGCHPYANILLYPVGCNVGVFRSFVFAADSA
jgi:hypothetical protein